MTAIDVLAVSEGVPRDVAIDEWCRSVWATFQDGRQTIVDLLHAHGIG
jgi:hypothetical protein